MKRGVVRAAISRATALRLLITGPTVALIQGQISFCKEKPRNGGSGAPPVLLGGPVCTREGKSRHNPWLNTVFVKVNSVRASAAPGLFSLA